MLRAAQFAFRSQKGRSPADFLRGLVGGFSTAPDCQRLAGKIAVITGAASGIGKATAAEFVRNGAKVILADVQDDAGRAVAAELGPAAAYTHCDVTDEAQIAAAVDLAVARHGRLDVLYSKPRPPRRWRRWTSPTSTASWRSTRGPRWPPSNTRRASWCPGAPAASSARGAPRGCSAASRRCPIASPRRR